VANFDERNRRVALFEKFFGELVELRDIAKVGHEHRHGDDVIESPTGFRQRDFDLIEGRFELRVKSFLNPRREPAGLRYVRRETAWSRL
jgi:hypothetical protein